MRRRGPGPHVNWCGVVVKLSDGRTVALEFDGLSNYVTADVHTVKPWDASSRNKVQDEVNIVIHGNGRVWTEGAGMGPTPPVRITSELVAGVKAIEGTVVDKDRE